MSNHPIGSVFDPPPFPPHPHPSAVRATITEKGDTAYTANFTDPLAFEIKKIVPKTTIGPAFDFHPSVDHLQISVGGMHGSYYPLLRDAAKTGLAVEELLKIGKALSSPVVTLDAINGMRKALADLIVLWDTGQVSPKAGLGKNLLPSYDLPNADISIENTVRNIKGARFSGSKAELSALDSVLAQYAKMAEPLRQMYTVRMSCQAEAMDRVLAAIQRARDSSDASGAAVAARSASLKEAHTDVVFVRAQMSALSALFKAMFLVIPGIISGKVLPQESDKEMTRQTASLIPVEELVRLQQLDEMRTEMASAATTTTPIPARKAKKETTDKADKPYKPKGSRRRNDFSSRSPATPASGGADKSAEGRSATQRKNDRNRAKARKKRQSPPEGGSDDRGNGGARDADGDAAGSADPKSGKHAGTGGASGGSGKRDDKPKKKKHKGDQGN